jgi:hypothetical protein
MPVIIIAELMLLVVASFIFHYLAEYLFKSALAFRYCFWSHYLITHYINSNIICQELDKRTLVR